MSKYLAAHSLSCNSSVYNQCPTQTSSSPMAYISGVHLRVKYLLDKHQQRCRETTESQWKNVLLHQRNEVLMTIVWASGIEFGKEEKWQRFGHVEIRRMKGRQAGRVVGTKIVRKQYKEWSISLKISVNSCSPFLFPSFPMYLSFFWIEVCMSQLTLVSLVTKRCGYMR